MKNEKTKFPIFSRFLPSHYIEYQDFLYEFPQHCDFSLNNMLIWLAGNADVDYSWLNNNLVLRVNDTIYGDQLEGSWVTVLGKMDADQTIDTILHTLSVDQLIMVPDYFVESIKNPSNYIITEDINNRDYILEINALIQKTGKKYENFRYQINYFLKNYSEEAVINNIDLQDSRCAQSLISALKSWPRVNSFGLEGNDPTRVDEKAINRLIKLQPLLPIKHKCLGLFINGELQGFSIYHIPHAKDNIALGNHIKYNAEYKRLFDFLVFATISRLKCEGIELLNAEQDMGVAGLRKHKIHLQPKMYYKKYSIARKNDLETH